MKTVKLDKIEQLTQFVTEEKRRADKAESERDALKRRVEELEALIKHIYHFGTIMTLEDHKAMMNWGKNEQ